MDRCMSTPRRQPNEPLSTGPAVELTGITRRFGTVRAVDQVDLTIHRGEFFSLLGPSGCGKTTLLRIIAGLELPNAGRVRIGGRDATPLPAHLRPVNTVFQSYALFPHLTVRENIEFGLRMKKVPNPDRAERVMRVMEMARLTDLAGRRPHQLSGGQRQRVALARAVVNEPEVLLLDEPLGALDLKLRKQLQMELHALQRRLGITFVYVTHDQEEALAMSDRVAVMNLGKIEQAGPPAEIYEQPHSRFVAEFVGASNLITGHVVRQDSGEVIVETASGELRSRLSSADKRYAPGAEAALAIRPEKVQIVSEERAPNFNSFKCRVADLIYSGAGTEYILESAAGIIKAAVLNVEWQQRGMRPGDSAWIHLPPKALMVL